jgi:SAM-dependent methyltransferase
MISAADQIVGLYQRHAADWATDRGTRLVLEKSWLDRFRALLPANSAVLDIGCGSADPMARYLIEQGHAVTGIDSSAALIALCLEKFPHQAWHVADMRSLALGGAFGGIIAWDSFFHLNPDDQQRMFPVFRRHAGPRAALMLTSGPAHGEAIGAYRGEPLYHASLDPAEYRALLAANGFGVVAHAVEDPDCGRHTVWLAQLK